MMKRLGRISAAVALVTGLSAGAAWAQATLGLTIDPTSGPRDTVVNGQVNPADVVANCVTDVTAFQARFTDLLNGPFVGGDTVGELPQTWFPDPNNIVYENTNQLAYVLTLAVVLGISADIGGAAANALPQTFVMTFAEFDQTPIGELGHFDPVTGVGSVVVPDIAPAIWPVAAACVGPSFDLDVLRAGIEASGVFLQSINAQFGPDGPFSPEFIQFMRDFLGPDAPADDFELLIAFVNAIGPTLLQPIVTPDALGVQLFTVTTATLGFTIDPTSGLPGDTVNGQVNTDDIAARCVTELEPFREQFALLFAEPFAGGGESGELFERFFPGGTFVFENHDQLAYSFTGLTSFGIAGDFNGAAQTALPQTFVMTFADLATQQPLGPLGHFDRFTGVGSVTVPDLDPGVYPIAATCVRPTFDLNMLEAGLRRNGAFFESIGMPITQPGSPEWEAFAQAFLGSSNTGIDLIFEFLNAVGPTLIQNIVTPGAVGVQFFTILADVDHFQCYLARSSGFNDTSVTLSDVFGNRTARVRSPINVCAPANKNGEDPEAPGSPDFLTSYKISVQGSFPNQTVTAENQFGPITLNVKKPKVLLVPTAVSTTAPPASPDGAFLNHFNCYDVRATNGTPAPDPGTVTVQTAFETVQVQPKRPRRLCVPTSKNGEPVIPSSPPNLLCYQGKSKGTLSPAPIIFIANQFGSRTQRLGQRREICIPTELTP